MPVERRLLGARATVDDVQLTRAQFRGTGHGQPRIDLDGCSGSRALWLDGGEDALLLAVDHHLGALHLVGPRLEQERVLVPWSFVISTAATRCREDGYDGHD